MGRLAIRMMVAALPFVSFGCFGPVIEADASAGGDAGDTVVVSDSEGGETGADETDTDSVTSANTGTVGPITDGPDGTTGSTGRAEESFGESTGESGAADEGEQPEEGMYSACVEVFDCPNDMGCVTWTDAPNYGFCSGECVGGTPDNCDPSPGGTAEPMCLAVEGLDVCALDCSKGKVCPVDMDCIQVGEGMDKEKVCL